MAFLPALLVPQTEAWHRCWVLDARTGLTYRNVVAASVAGRFLIRDRRAHPGVFLRGPDGQVLTERLDGLDIVIWRSPDWRGPCLTQLRIYAREVRARGLVPACLLEPRPPVRQAPPRRLDPLAMAAE